MEEVSLHCHSCSYRQRKMEGFFRMCVLLLFCGMFFELEVNGNFHHMYLGCFIEVSSNHAVPDHRLNNLPNNSAEFCLSHCRFHGARNAGLRRGHKCFCADDGAHYDMHGKAPESECGYVCTGDETQICGGELRMSLYDLWGIYLADKAIIQSSVSSGGVPERAVDGNPDSGYQSDSCTHTAGHQTTPAWWRVDLGEDMCIGRVVIVNRAEPCCAGRLVDTVVKIGTRYLQCGAPVSATQAAPGARVVIECDPPICGRYVRIVTGLGVNKGVLTMCEVYMFRGACDLGCPERVVEYTRVSETQCIGTIDTTIQTLSARSKIECSRFCLNLNDVRCRSFDFAEDSHHGDGYICRLQSSETTSGLLDEDGCDFYMESHLANSLTIT